MRWALPKAKDPDPFGPRWDEQKGVGALLARDTGFSFVCVFAYFSATYSQTNGETHGAQLSNRVSQFDAGSQFWIGSACLSTKRRLLKPDLHHRRFSLCNMWRRSGKRCFRNTELGRDLQQPDILQPDIFQPDIFQPDDL